MTYDIVSPTCSTSFRLRYNTVSVFMFFLIIYHSNTMPRKGSERVSIIRYISGARS